MAFFLSSGFKVVVVRGKGGVVVIDRIRDYTMPVFFSCLFVHTKLTCHFFLHTKLS